MNAITDLQVDEMDDIILQSSDLLIDSNPLRTSLNAAARRIVARYDDAPFRDGLCAGLERFLFSTNIKKASYDVKSAIIKVLSRDNLFNSNEFEVKLVNSENPREAKLYIVFKPQFLSSVPTFKIFVDIENQRVYKG
jgi:hypothetical protein